MSAQIAVFLWIAFVIGLKLTLLAYDPKYRKAYGKWQSPTQPFKIIRAFPLFEIGWFVAMMGSFAPMVWWLVK